MGFGASTAARDANYQVGDMYAVKMGIGTIYKGDIVVIKAADGYAYSQYATGATGDSFVGVAAETITATVAGATRIRVYTEGVFEFTWASAAQTNVGDLAYSQPGASGSPTVVGGADTHSTLIGKVLDWPAANTVKVKICPASSALAT